MKTCLVVLWCIIMIFVYIIIHSPEVCIGISFMILLYYKCMNIMIKWLEKQLHYQLHTDE
jgi:NADH:ubiquinone oxidoreductase subunit K